MPGDLSIVYTLARQRAGEDRWPRLTAHEQTIAIYQEFGGLDVRHTDRMSSEFSKKMDFVSSGTISPTVVRLRLSGQMQAWTVSGENIVPTGRKTRALLAVIALSVPRPALRGRLAELLWSRRPEEQARASLRQEIQLLLRALAPAKTEILRVTRDHLSLVPGVTWVDVQEIMRSATDKQAALSLLDGELLEDLDGIDPTFDMWLTTERERLRDRARGMAEMLLREQTAPDGVIAAVQRLLQIDRAHEEAWRALMRAYADQGERGMAIQAYDRCRAVLADQLDAVPSEETQSLLREIRGPSSKRLPVRPPHPPTEEPPPDGQIEDDSEATQSPFRGARIGVLPPRCVGLPEDATFLGPSLATEITTALSRFRWMSVVSSNSLARHNRDVTAIRRSGEVDYLLDGAVQRSRGTLRITLRLLDLRLDNQVIWARRFDRPDDDPLSVQDHIAAAVAAQIEPIVLLTEARRNTDQKYPDESAYELVLRAAPLIARLEREGFTRAGEHLARAIELQPEHASAHAWYAAWHCLLISQGWEHDLAEARARAGEFAARSILLDAYSAGSFAVAAHVRAVALGDPIEAATLHERALELNPNLAAGWALSAVNQIFLGNIADAERRYQHYKALAPLDPYSFLFDGLFAAVHVLKHDFQAAVTLGRTVTQLNPSYAAGYKPYLAALGHLGETHEATQVLRRLRAVEPTVTIARSLMLFPLERTADRDLFAEGLRLAGIT